MEDGIVPPPIPQLGGPVSFRCLVARPLVVDAGHSVTTLWRITGPMCHPITSQSVVDTLVQVHVNDGRVAVKVWSVPVVVDIDH
jgi:hypothetical protein